jgi:hypothetical protein
VTVPAVPGSEVTAPRVVERLVADIEAELDGFVDRIVERIRTEIPDFRRLSVATLRRAVRGNVGRALAALRELRPPTPDELEGSAAIGRERAEQGLTVDAVLHAYRIWHANAAPTWRACWPSPKRCGSGPTP